MSIESKLFFEFRKEYPELLASDVAEFVATKDYETEKATFESEVLSEEVKDANGKVDYIKYTRKGKNINNVRGGVSADVIQETAELEIFNQYKKELEQFIPMAE